ncbi:hypothetical protein FRC07_002051 [Ceratobasidium sp. 392]|nr:hypothetical protein FRC07_002051 [Ceratobasidium sp. 392]
MTDVIDVEQTETASLLAPSTSHTPAPRLEPSTPSRSLTPVSPRPCDLAPLQRMTRARTAAATASGSGSQLRSDITAARHPRRHVKNTVNAGPKREPSSSLTPPPPGITAGERSEDIRNNSGSVQTEEHGAESRYTPRLVSLLPSTDNSHAGPSGNISRSTEQIDTSVVDNRPATAAASSPLVTVARATSPANDDHPVTLPTDRAPSPPSNPRQKRKRSDSGSDNGPLLSEYMCPICFSPPKSAIITPTPIPNLRFVVPEPHPKPGIVPGSHGPNATGTRARRPRRRFVPPPSRTLSNGIGLPTHGDDMIDLDRVGNVSEGETIDIDDEEGDEEIDDAARSGVIGLELLTMASL